MPTKARCMWSINLGCLSHSTAGVLCMTGFICCCWQTVHTAFAAWAAAALARAHQADIKRQKLKLKRQKLTHGHTPSQGIATWTSHINVHISKPFGCAGGGCSGEGVRGRHEAAEAGAAAAPSWCHVCTGQLARRHPPAGPGCHPIHHRASTEAAQAAPQSAGVVGLGLQETGANSCYRLSVQTACMIGPLRKQLQQCPNLQV